MTPMEPPRRRRLLVGAVGLLLRYRLKGAGKILLEVRNELEAQLPEAWLAGAEPFDTVSLILRYGTKDDPDLLRKRRIDKRHRELHVAMELDGARLKSLESDPEALRESLRSSIVFAIESVAAVYGLSKPAYQPTSAAPSEA